MSAIQEVQFQVMWPKENYLQTGVSWGFLKEDNAVW